MQSLQTIVDAHKLDRWARALPDCEVFLYNFFCSCRSYTWQTNFVNYLCDVEEQSAIHPIWQSYEAPLLQAFMEITGRDYLE